MRASTLQWLVLRDEKKIAHSKWIHVVNATGLRCYLMLLNFLA